MRTGDCQRIEVEIEIEIEEMEARAVSFYSSQRASIEIRHCIHLKFITCSDLW